MEKLVWNERIGYDASKMYDESLATIAVFLATYFRTIECRKICRFTSVASYHRGRLLPWHASIGHRETLSMEPLQLLMLQIIMIIIYVILENCGI